MSLPFKESFPQQAIRTESLAGAPLFPVWSAAACCWLAREVSWGRSQGRKNMHSGFPAWLQRKRPSSFHQQHLLNSRASCSLAYFAYSDLCMMLMRRSSSARKQLGPGRRLSQTGAHTCTQVLTEYTKAFLKTRIKAEEVAQWLKALTALPEDIGSVPRTHKEVYNHQFQGFCRPLLASQAHIQYSYKYAGKTLRHIK